MGVWVNKLRGDIYSVVISISGTVRKRMNENLHRWKWKQKREKNKTP